MTASASAGSSTVSVSWTGSTLSNGTPAQGYYVTRTNVSTSQTSAACGSSASSLITSTSCSDTSVPDGTYTYKVIAVYRSWTASERSRQPGHRPGRRHTALDRHDLSGGGRSLQGFGMDRGLLAQRRHLRDRQRRARSQLRARCPFFASRTAKYWDGTGYNDSGENFRTATGTTTWRYALALPPDGAYTVHVRATDGLGNTTSSGSYVVRHFTIDATAPTATVSTSASATNTQPITYAVTFSEPVSDLAASGVTLTVPAGNPSASKSVSKTDSQHFTVSVERARDERPGDGAVSVQVNADAVTDSAGNDNTASNTASE